MSSVQYGLSEQYILAMCDVFKAYPKIDKVILYGSRAKGNYRPESDIDLTLLGDKLNFEDLVAIDNALDDLLMPYSIDLSIYKSIENQDLLDHIKRVGREFYSRN